MATRPIAPLSETLRLLTIAETSAHWRITGTVPNIVPKETCDARILRVPLGETECGEAIG